MRFGQAALVSRVTFASVFALLLLVPRDATACGAPVVVAPGKPGTALFEGPDQISAFVATDQGMTWVRMSAPDWSPVHVLDIAGPLSGNVETDARVERAISSQNGAPNPSANASPNPSIIEISAAGVVPISSDSGSATTVFGSRLDGQLHWQVLAYQPNGNQLTLYSESAPGTFVQTAQTSANCGDAEMLDLVVESDGTLVGICGGQAVTVSGSTLVLTVLPVDAWSLGLSTSGSAIFYGMQPDLTHVVRMSRSGSGFAVDATFEAPGAQWFIAVDENTVVTVLDQEGTDSRVYSNSGSAWQSYEEYLPEQLISAAGGRLLSGEYQLELDTKLGASWTRTELGQLGVAPVYGDSGCASPGPANWVALLGMLSLLATKRRRALAAFKA